MNNSGTNPNEFESFSIKANLPGSGNSEGSVNSSSQGESSTASASRVNLTGSNVNSDTPAKVEENDTQGKRVNRDAVRAYLTEVYEGVPGLLSVWSVPAKGSGKFFLTNREGLEQAVDWIESQWTINAQQGIYSRITTVKEVPKDKKSRGNASQSASFIGLWTDLDFGTDGHKGGKLPPDEATAQQVYDRSGLPEASIVVNSGGGLYHLVLLEKPLDITETELRLRVGQLARRWQIKVKETAEKMGYDYGTGVNDLARVLRIPGTINAKVWSNQRTAVHRSTGLRYTLEELEAACPEPIRPKRQSIGQMAVAQAGDARERMLQLADEMRNTTFERNNALNRLTYMCFQYAGAGQLDPAEVEDVFTRAGLDTGLEPAEVRNTVRSAQKGMSEPYTWTVRMRTVQDAEQYDMWAGQLDDRKQYIGDGASVPNPRTAPEAQPGDDEGQNQGGNPGTFSAPDAPMRVARELEPTWIRGGSRTLHHWRDTWMRWTGTHWSEVGVSALKSSLYLKLEHAIYYAPTKKGELEPKPWNPSIKKIAALVDAIAAVTHLDERTGTGEWLGPHKGGPSLISCANVMVDPLTRETHEHTPAYFNTVAVPYAFDPEAQCPQWLAFLEEVFDNDQESKDALQEWAGYVLSGRTDLQKGIQLIGPPRAGKGTIARILEKLIGKENAVGTTLKSLVTNFGLQPLIGKSLCIIGDAQMENRNSSEIVARLLSIIGEDSLTVDRKNRSQWDGKLGSRFMILANKAPKFSDSSGAAVSRFVTLHFTRSFLGKEDPTLEGKLTAELAGIFNWALDGLARLSERGRFVQPGSSESIIESQREESAPHQSFVEERCVLGAEHWIIKEQLFAFWQMFCSANGIRYTGTGPSFAADLYAAVPGIKKTRKRVNGKPEHVYTGITAKVQPGIVCPPGQSDPRN